MAGNQEVVGTNQIALCGERMSDTTIVGTRVYRIRLNVKVETKLVKSRCVALDVRGMCNAKAKLRMGDGGYANLRGVFNEFATESLVSTVHDEYAAIRIEHEH